MASGGSPFRAGFGKTPPVLVGRDRMLHDFDEALNLGSWTQNRVTLIEGLRGVGKTVMLNVLEDRARTRGWAVISETATPGLADRIMHAHLPSLLRDRAPSSHRHVTGVSAAGWGVSTSYADTPEPSQTLSMLLAQLDDVIGGRGILITVDEIGAAGRDDLAALTTGIQHAVREDREIAFVGAGLTASIVTLLAQPALTFLRRASRHTLDFLDYDEAVTAIGEPIAGAGRRITDEALSYAAAATQGYPFLTQLIGDLAWRASPDRDTIDVDDVKKAYRTARRTMGSHILEPSLRELSPVDRTVLAVIATHDGPTRTADVRAVLGVDARYMGVYRQRLIDAGLVYAVRRGVVDIAVPYLREYLREHVVTDAAADRARRRATFPPPPALDDPDRRQEGPA